MLPPMQHWTTIGLAGLLVTTSVRSQGTKPVGQVGARADQSADLVRVLGGTDVDAGHRAARKLVRLEDQAVAALLARLTLVKVDSVVAERICRVLRHLRGHAKAAVPTLAKRLGKARGKPGQALLRAMTRLAPFAPDQHGTVDQALEAFFWRSNGWIPTSVETARLVAPLQYALEVNAGMSTAQLVEALHGPKTMVRAAAARLLGDSVTDRKSKVSTLLDALDELYTQEKVHVGFKSTNRSTKMSFLHKDFSAERRAIAEALLRLAPPSEIPAQALVLSLELDDPSLVRRAIVAIGLRRIPEAIDKLTALAEADHRAMAYEAITTLGQFGSVASPAMTALRRLAKSTDKGTAVRANSALGMIGR